MERTVTIIDENLIRQGGATLKYLESQLEEIDPCLLDQYNLGSNKNKRNSVKSYLPKETFSVTVTYDISRSGPGSVRLSTAEKLYINFTLLRKTVSFH